MKKIFGFLAATAIFVACGEEKAGNVSITGNITNGTDKKLYIEQMSFTPKTFKDSVEIGSDGSLKFNPKVPEKGFYKVYQNPSNFVILILDTVDKITINGDLTNIAETYTVEGNKDSELLWQFNNYMKISARKLDSLSKVFAQNQSSPDIAAIQQDLEAKYMVEVKNKEEFLAKFVRDNSSSFACLAVVEQLNADDFYEEYKLVNKNLLEKYPNSEYTITFNSRVSELGKLAVGTQAPDIIMNDPSGKTLKLSDLKGKIVLIDFWASWCKPCRAENPNVVRVYNTYKSKGFEIFGVSLDKEKGAWEAAIQQDKLTWNHVSDLGFWNSPVVKTYNISGIPFTVLLDKEGKIIAKNLRGQQLEAKLAELLGS